MGTHAWSCLGCESRSYGVLTLTAAPDVDLLRSKMQNYYLFFLRSAAGSNEQRGCSGFGVDRGRGGYQPSERSQEQALRGATTPYDLSQPFYGYGGPGFDQEQVVAFVIAVAILAVIASPRGPSICNSGSPSCGCSPQGAEAYRLSGCQPCQTGTTAPGGLAGGARGALVGGGVVNKKSITPASMRRTSRFLWASSPSAFGAVTLIIFGFILQGAFSMNQGASETKRPRLFAAGGGGGGG